MHLPMKKLNQYKELIYSSHTASKWQSRGFKPGHWAPEPKCPPFPPPGENTIHKLEMPSEWSGSTSRYLEAARMSGKRN